MALKRVLVSYLDRNKVIAIPDNSGGDVEYVTKAFKKIFNIVDSVNQEVQSGTLMWTSTQMTRLLTKTKSKLL